VWGCCSPRPPTTRKPRAKEQVISALRKIEHGNYKEAPVAARAIRELADPQMDTLRMRDEFLKVLDAFAESTRGL